MVMKIVKNFSKIIFLILINAIFAMVLLAADNENSTGQVIRGLDNNGNVVIVESNQNSSKQKSKVNTPTAKASDKYLNQENLKLQKKEEEERNKALREQNQIGILYSDKYRAQNNDDVSQFEEEIFRSQINDTGVFLSDDKNLNFSKKDERITVQAIQEGVLAEYKDDADKKNKKILDFKNPIFFVSEGTDSFSYTNTMDLCSVVNFGYSVDCLVYPELDPVNIPSILRRGVNSDFYEKTGVNADFIIVRDDVYSQYRKGRGNIALAPELDVLMYLNGEYLFMFANSMSNIFSFEHLSAQKQRKQIKVGFINQQSKVIFERTLAKLFPNHLYIYQPISVSTLDITRDSICNPTDVDVYIYFGGKLPNNLEKAMDDCSSIINPLTLSDSTLAEVIKLTDFFSIANVVGYYPTPSVINYLEIYVALENSYRKSLKDGNSASINKINLADYSDKGKTETKEVAQPKAPAKMTARDKEIEAKRKRAEMLAKQRTEERTKRINELKEKRKEKKRKEQEILDKKLNKKASAKKDNPSKESSFFSFLNFSSKSNVVEKKKEEPVYLNQELIIKEDSLKNIKGRTNNSSLLGVNVYATEKEKEKQRQDVPRLGRAYVTVNAAVKTFGIRYVLLASRYAKRENVISVFDSIVKDFFLIRGSVLTPDVAKFSVADIILGTSEYSKIEDYHPALSKYPNYLLELKTKKTPEQTLALMLLNSNVSNVKYPSNYGPATLSAEQMDALYTKARELNKIKDELAAIRIYQRDIMNIDKALEEMRDGKQPSDSLLKTTGLDYVNAIFDEQSVVSQGMATEERLTPQAMREIEQLVDPKTIPVEAVSADNIKDAVDATEGNNIEEATDATATDLNVDNKVPKE